MGHSSHRLESTFTWQKYFNFCEVKKDGVRAGWEVSCSLSDHRPASGSCTRCTRTMRFNKSNGDEHMVEKKLKWWALQGLTCTDKLEHGKLDRDGPALLDLESFETFVVPDGLR